jgi:hypothetical protein
MNSGTSMYLLAMDTTGGRRRACEAAVIVSMVQLSR